MGFIVKLLAIAKQKDGKIEVRVHPVFLPKHHPLASVNGAFNAVFVVGDAVGDIMLYGQGAGALPTGSAIVSDIVFCARQETHARYGEMNDVVDAGQIIADFESEYYLRLNVRDVSGVIADIANVFKKHHVSISRMRQDEGGEIVPIVFFTHKSHEQAMSAAIEEIRKLHNVVSVENVIRVER